MYTYKLVASFVVCVNLIVNAKECMDYDESKLSTQNECCAKEKTGSPCPEKLAQFVPGVCYVLLTNQSFPPNCPYQNFLPYHKILFMFKILNLENEDIWIHAMRNSSANIGNYEWIERGDYYGETIKTNIVNSNFSISNNCLFVQNEKFIPTNCSALHSSLCVYSYNMTQYCTNNYKKGNCVSSHFDFYNGDCYCKITFEELTFKHNQSCQQLAEPKLPFQTNLLLQTFTDLDLCWFGLTKLQNYSCFWSSNSEPLKYSYWSDKVNCAYLNGAISFKEDSGWLLLNNSSLSCSICYVTIEPKKVSLELYHNLNKDILKLMIQNPLSIADRNGYFDVYCFSTTNTDDFKYKLSLDVKDLGSNNTMAVIQLPQIREYPGHYWCSAFQFPYNEIVHSNTIVTYNRTKRYGYEYSLLLKIRTFGYDPLVNKMHAHTCNFISMCLSNYVNTIIVRPMQIVNYNETEEIFEMIAHISTKNANQNHLQEYYTLFQTLYIVNMSHSDLTMGELLSTSVCFQGFTLTLDGDLLEWPETNIGVTAIPVNKLCFDSSNDTLPVTRKCEGSFMFGAKWSNVEGTCAKNIIYSQSTKELFYLLKLNTVEQGIEEILADISAHNDNNSVINVYLISQILRAIADKSTKVNNDFFKTIDNLMNFNRKLLNDSQGLLNSTDQVLFSLDTILLQLDQSVEYKSPNLILRIIDLKPVISVAVVISNNNQSINNFNSYNVSIFYDNVYNFEEDENVEIAIRISSKTLEHMKNQSNPENPFKMVIAIFNNDFLFNQKDKLSYYPIGNKVVSVSWIGFNGYLKSPIQIMFKKRNASDESKCGYWDYGWDQLMISKYGQWAFDNSSFNTSSAVKFCEFYHTTHFGLLLIDNFFDESEKHEKYLRILFAIGSAVSLFGIFPIFLTAIFHKPWRHRPATKILIQLCITIVIQTTLLFLSDLVTEDGVLCKVIGASTHYIVLAEFCWMFVIGMLQYRKFVIIMKPPPNNVLQISAIIGWGLPIVPIFITLAISTNNYGLINNKLLSTGS
ncbi:hypothetical protein RN001_006207 [Aquatica leii]|uniref:G-protein coupled receptors family 2 profile 2 domain-containing protein n=1 Tax=Aquatica leii TaxID=1421715 RepID=A0AAN7QKV0_9COLE|nr:hypothetical protein RN001_006207 [Aquatica leii]